MNSKVLKVQFALMIAALFCFCFVAKSPAFDDARIRALVADPTPGEWRTLEHYDSTLTRFQFEQRLNSIFDPGHGFSPFLRINDRGVTILGRANDNSSAVATVTFRENPDGNASGNFRSPEEFRRSSRFFGRVLSGLHVAIEPADIGGAWGGREDRSSYYPGYGRIQEGDINLIVAFDIKKRLRELGADVYLARTRDEPVAPFGMDDISPEVTDILTNRRYLLPMSFFQRIGSLSPRSPRYREIATEALYTKTFETRARAQEVREHFHPDLTVVLQHDATGSSSHGGLASSNRNIFFVEGAYTPSEVSKDPGQRLRLLTKLFQQVTPVEVEVADNIARAFVRRTGYPPVLYGNGPTTRIVCSDPYVVARNLAFSREHDGPVVVTEPYFMNNPLTLRRLLAGDYDGTRLINGRMYESIFREYAEAVCDGLVKSYSRTQ